MDVDLSPPVKARSHKFWRMMRFCLNPRAWLRVILSLDDTPHRLALGTAIGMFVGLTPTGGIQMALVLLIGQFLRFNRVAGLAAVYVSNPVTAIPLAYLSYRVGALFCGETLTFHEFTMVFERHWTEQLRFLFVEIGIPYLIGTFTVAAITSSLTYPTVYWLVRSLRRDRPSTPSIVKESDASRVDRVGVGML